MINFMRLIGLDEMETEKLLPIQVVPGIRYCSTYNYMHWSSDEDPKRKSHETEVNFFRNFFRIL